MGIEYIRLLLFGCRKFSTGQTVLMVCCVYEYIYYIGALNRVGKKPGFSEKKPTHMFFCFFLGFFEFVITKMDIIVFWGFSLFYQYKH